MDNSVQLDEIKNGYNLTVSEMRENQLYFVASDGTYSDFVLYQKNSEMLFAFNGWENEDRTLRFSELAGDEMQYMHIDLESVLPELFLEYAQEILMDLYNDYMRDEQKLAQSDFGIVNTRESIHQILNTDARDDVVKPKKQPGHDSIKDLLKNNLAKSAKENSESQIQKEDSPSR